MPNPNYKILQHHSTDCNIDRKINGWKHPWGVLKEKVYGTLNNPTRHGYRPWLIYGCNRVGCTAELAILESSFLDKAPWGNTVGKDHYVQPKPQPLTPKKKK